jgi:hypothetical protein
MGLRPISLARQFSFPRGSQRESVAKCRETIAIEKKNPTLRQNRARFGRILPDIMLNALLSDAQGENFAYQASGAQWRSEKAPIPGTI